VSHHAVLNSAHNVGMTKSACLPRDPQIPRIDKANELG
jgi:hypothetical protein